MRLSSHRLIAVTLATGALALLLAACGDDDSASDAPADTGTSSSLVSVEDVDGTSVLAEAGGQTLYTADVERGGEILCTGACTSFWEPIAASSQEAESAAADLDLDLGVVERPDGDRQLTLDGLPLYSFTEEGPGELTGDGFVDDFDGTHFEWEAAAAGTSPEPASAPSPSPSPY
jgi:predicted lipoprotein with Yx(FWY)xxD motif